MTRATRSRGVRSSTARTGADALAMALIDDGVEVVFGVPGAYGLAMADAIGCEPGLTCVTARHEQDAAFMADGYARVSGRPAACMVTYGPGVLNAMTGIASARADAIPMLVLTSGPAAADRCRPGHVHDLPEQEALIRLLDVAVLEARAASEVAGTVSRAVDLCSGEPPRPVVVHLADDVLAEHLTTDHAGLVGSPADAISISAAEGESRLLPELVSVRSCMPQAAGLINNSTRPILVLGGGVRSAEDRLAARVLAERLEAPVLSTVLGKGAVAETHALSAGHCLHAPEGEQLLAESDLAIVVGTDLGVLDTRDAKLSLPKSLILINHASSPPGPDLYRPTVRISASLSQFTEELLTMLTPTSRRSRLASIAEARVSIHQRLQEVSPLGAGMVDAIARTTGPADHVVVDVTIAASWIWNLLPSDGPSTVLTPFHFAPLGYALPAAVGAQLAAPASRVLCVAGDGGFFFSSQELATVSELGLPVVVLIVNNESFGSTAFKQRAAYGRTAFASLKNPDLIMFARSFGIAGTKTDVGQLAEVLARAYQARAPSLIELSVDLPMPLPSTPNSIRDHHTHADAHR